MVLTQYYWGCYARLGSVPRVLKIIMTAQRA
jgi:hypothetical protein